jgi:hypothetical protein
LPIDQVTTQAQGAATYNPPFGAHALVFQPQACTIRGPYHL